MDEDHPLMTAARAEELVRAANYPNPLAADAAVAELRRALAHDRFDSPATRAWVADIAGRWLGPEKKS